MSDLPDGLDDNAMMAAVAWEIVNYAYLRTAYFSERPSEEVFTSSPTNSAARARRFITGNISTIPHERFDFYKKDATLRQCSGSASYFFSE